MPTIYRYTTPYTVSQERYDALILRDGYFSIATQPSTDTDLATPARVASKLTYPRPNVTAHVTSMQSGHGWTASNALSSNLNDTTTYALGSQSASITSKTDTTAATLTKTGLSLDITATKQLRLLIRVEDADNINGAYLYVSSDSMVANFTAIPIQTITADPGIRWVKNGEWKWVTVNLASGAVTGSPNFAAVDSLRIRLTSISGVSTTVRLQAVQVMERKSFAAGGIVSLSYDDSYFTQNSLAKVHLDKWGFPATAFTIASNVRDGDAGNGTWLTTSMLQDMRRNSRWEIALHTHMLGNHARAYSGATSALTGTVYGTNPLSPDELDYDIAQELAWLQDNDLTDGFPGHAYPQGRFNTVTRTHMARRLSYARANTGLSNGMETIPPADPYALRTYSLDNNSVIATLQAQVDAAAANGSWLIYTCHDLATTPATSTQFKTADHATLVDYVAGKAGLRVMTIGDVMRGLVTQS